MNSSPIAENLWQGSAPTSPYDQRTLHQRFDVLVLCAEEFQPEASLFPGVEVIHAGFHDGGDPPTKADIATAKAAAEVVADRLQRDRRVLVTCWLGINRSGLVTALALCNVTGMSGADAVSLIRSRRPGSLLNEHFVRLLYRIPERRQTRARARPR